LLACSLATKGGVVLLQLPFAWNNTTHGKRVSDDEAVCTSRLLQCMEAQLKQHCRVGLSMGTVQPDAIRSARQELELRKRTTLGVAVRACDHPRSKLLNGVLVVWPCAAWPTDCPASNAAGCKRCTYQHCEEIRCCQWAPMQWHCHAAVTDAFSRSGGLDPQTHSTKLCHT
jgi:hypothetical protein